MNIELFTIVESRELSRGSNAALFITFGIIQRKLIDFFQNSLWVEKLRIFEQIYR